MAEREKEAQRLWTLMRQLEHTQSKTPEEFKFKQREMEKLRAAYAKVTGLSGDPGNMSEQDALTKAKVYGGVVSRPDVETADSLNQIQRDVVNPLEKGD